MAHSSSSPELPPIGNNVDSVALNKDLERMIEEAETLSVQLTWMTYDMVALRTSPELGESVRKLEEACVRCRAAVCGETEQEPETETCLEDSVSTQNA
ncbi:synaptonemal complex central element protein 3 [Parambassis ranga]|uniref:Synaptonemal complex central element protein 3 n=1 Tax=Parambassis ranga TaxID=210632 RepID=A0A6P7J7K1_9TELE|nr:synaptonemal complex central element protein 3 [Parambassis ranga]